MNLDFDRQHIWHPYTSITQPAPVFPVARADGVILQLEDGRQLVDGMSSWWCMLHGYNHPVLNQAIIDQTQRMAHVMFGGLTHEPAITLAEKLVNLTPKPLQRLFLCDSGSISVEVAMKMALQYWQTLGQPQKQRLLSFRKGYHGDTFAAMSVCDPHTGMHHLFADAIRQQVFAESPVCKFGDEWDEAAMNDVENKLAQHCHELAAVIIEPIVQATGGMNFYSPMFLHRLRELCDQYKVLLIADEIATNFGRTGELFACNHAGISPDIMCLGKALTGGYMTLAATICTEEVGATVCAGEAGVLMHGPTFMANPLACAVANASIDLLLSSPWQQRIQMIATQLEQELSDCRSLPQVSDVRVLGGIGVVELKAPIDLKTYQQRFVDEGVWVRPFGKLVYLMPPFIIASRELTRLTTGMKNVIKSIN